MPCEVVRTALTEVLIVKPTVFADVRGFFVESFNARDFEAATGLRPAFVQDNHSFSTRGVLRGLHYQIERPQGKLVRVAHGEVFDVVVDLRRRSRTFGKSVGIVLSRANMHQLWVPAGFAHGFLVTSKSADVLYKTTEYRYAKYERRLLWNDPVLQIDWPLNGMSPQLNEKDLNAVRLEYAEVYE